MNDESTRRRRRGHFDGSNSRLSLLRERDQDRSNNRLYNNSENMGKIVDNHKCIGEREIIIYGRSTIELWQRERERI